MIIGSIFKDAVVTSVDEEFINCEFNSGTTAKQKGVFGLTANGDANITVKGCKFANKGYSGVYMNTTGEVNIEDCEFDCSGLYNPIEGSSSAASGALTKVNIKNNVMNGICGNNYFNFYNFTDGAVINVEDNIVKDMSQQAEVVRISNVNSTSATINIKNISYNYDMDTNFDADWTKMILFQDYSAAGAGAQDFTKLTVNVDGVNCNGEEVTAIDKFPVGGLFVVYDNQDGVIATNQPAISFSA